MPLHIIRQDITKVPCDVIVNTTNRHVSCDYGVAGAILDAAGEELRKYLPSFIEVGEVYVTPAFNLPSKAIIHVVGPVWRGGGYLEKELLAVSYNNVLEKAVELDASSVAIPLIAAGSRGFPKEYVLSIAVDTIAAFLEDNELDVYLVVYDKNSYSIGKELFGDITDYIRDNFAGEEDEYAQRREYNYAASIDLSSPQNAPQNRLQYRRLADEKEAVRWCCARKPIAANVSQLKRAEDVGEPTDKSTYITGIEEILAKADDGFTDTLLKLIDARGMSDIECYKNANVSRQTWHKIISDKGYRPSKTTVIAFAISLKLSLAETVHLLETVGYAFSKSSKFDLIISYLISRKEYNVFKINDILFYFDQELLGV